MDKAMDILLNGKTDAELLDALVLALSGNNDFLLNELDRVAEQTTIRPAIGANIEIARQIARIVLTRINERGKKETPNLGHFEVTGQRFLGADAAVSARDGYEAIKAIGQPFNPDTK